jgi:exosortase A-associated hydrolase 1
MLETPVVFTSRDQQLVGIEHTPTHKSEKNDNIGVLIVVGGPQTRVGSHRLFVQLARSLAEQGYYVFRFDYTGAGDSEGGITEFTGIQADIDAAIIKFRQQQPHISEFKLWGLCDAASAILMYIEQTEVHDITGLVLVNPWVRQESTQAKTYLKSYYIKRLLSKSFWLKLFKGKVKTVTAFDDIREFQKKSKHTSKNHSFVNQMYTGLHLFSGSTTILLSEYDLTADEFTMLTQEDKLWRLLTLQNNITVHTIEQANHTFSNTQSTHELIKQTLMAIE